MDDLFQYSLELKILVVHFQYDENHLLKANLISKGTIDTIPYQVISSSIQSTKVALALEESNIDAEELAMINSPVVIERTILDQNEKGEEEGAQMIMSTVFPMIILPFFNVLLSFLL